MNAIADPGRSARLISPLQAAIGTFFGGPIAFAYFIRRNDFALGNRKAARRNLAILMLVLIASNAPFAFAILMPGSIALNLGLGAVPFLLAIAAYRMTERRIESADRPLVFRSGWSVAGCAALGFMASAACALATIAGAVIFLLATSGFR
jgi:hypothetical protein